MNEALIEALRQDPSSVESVENALAAVSEAGDPLEALAAVEPVAEETNHPLHLFLLSEALHLAGRANDAEHVLRRGHRDPERRALFESFVKRHPPRWQERIRFYWLNRIYGLEGKSVLEVGGRLPAEFVAPVRPAGWTSLDPKNENAESAGYRLTRGDAANIPFPEGSFDVVFSSSAFEHIPNLSTALLEMHRVLKIGGIVYSDFGPIWSSSGGHHIRGPAQQVLKDAGLWPFPDWGQLTMTRSELAEFISERLEPEAARRVDRSVHVRPSLNRLFYEDYVHYFHASPLRVVRLDPKIGKPPPEEVVKLLSRRHPGRTNFHVNGFRVVLGKEA